MLFLSAPSLSPAWHGQAGGLALSQCQGATAGLSALIRSRQKKKNQAVGQPGASPGRVKPHRAYLNQLPSHQPSQERSDLTEVRDAPLWVRTEGS